MRGSHPLFSGEMTLVKGGSIQLAALSIEEKHVLGLIRQSQYYAPELLLDVWRAYLARQQAQANPSLTIAELCKAFYDRQIKEGRAYRTIADDRWRLKTTCNPGNQRPGYGNRPINDLGAPCKS